MREIELKLEVDPDDLPMVREDPLLARAESRENHQVTVYYDTPETKLKKHGFTLRVRSVAGKFIQTIKPITGAVGLVSREEIELEVPSLEPELGPLSDHPLRGLLGKAGAAQLEAVIVSDVDRTSWVIDRGHQSIQVDLDHGTISAGEHSEEFAEIEFELRDGSPAGLIMLGRHFADRAPVRLGVLTKAERGFMVAEGSYGKVNKSTPVHVRRGMDVAEAFEIIVHACLRHYSLNEPLALRRRSAAALHQSRVAMRRLRSALTFFRPAIEDVEFQHLRHELRWFTSQLGPARNFDVYLERDLDPVERADVSHKRERAYDDVADAMNSHRFRLLMIDLVGWTALGAWRRGKVASRSIEGFADRRLDRMWESIVGAGRNLADLDEESRHELRIQCKKLRYATEFLRGVYPDAHAQEKRFSAAIEQLQESLGKLNDMATARTLGASTLDEGWLIGSLGERREILAAEDAFRDLVRAGAFWHPKAAVLHN